MNKRESFAKFEKSLEKVNKIYLSSHVSVDVDNLGSTLALKHILTKLGKDAYVIKSDVIPKTYNFLPGIETFIDMPSKVPDMYISLDSGSIERLGNNKEMFLRSPIKVVIDHHSSNNNYGDVNIIDPNISSTCELLCEFIDYLGIEIDSDIATCLFAGISGDTGRFLYDNADYETYLNCANLIKKGADVSLINLNLYQSRSLEKTKILERSLKEMKIICDGQIAYTVVTREMLHETNTNIYELDEPIIFLINIDRVKCAFIIKEKDENEYKVSLRSKSNIDVNKIAQKFGGGGHKKAAGLTYQGDCKTLTEKLIEEIKKDI